MKLKGSLHLKIGGPVPGQMRDASNARHRVLSFYWIGVRLPVRGSIICHPDVFELEALKLASRQCVEVLYVRP